LAGKEGPFIKCEENILKVCLFMKEVKYEKCTHKRMYRMKQI
jgi:hypothetical protein